MVAVGDARGFDSAQALELLDHDPSLQLALSGQGGVHPIAPAAAAITSVRTCRIDPVLGRLDDLNRFTPSKALLPLGDSDLHPLARQRSLHEYHFTRVESGNTLAASRNPVDLKFGWRLW